MAVTGAITLTPATALINQPVQCNLTLTNSTGSTVTVLSAVPTTVFTGASNPMPSAAAVGSMPLSAGYTTSISASGTLVLPFTLVFFAPSTGPLGTGFGNYTVSASVQMTDGTYPSITAASAFVNPIALASTEQ